MKKTLKNGFTLVELMIVVAIIAILSAVAVPRFGKQIQKAKDAKALSLVGNWRSASTLYYTDHEGDYATDFGDLAEAVDTQTQNQTFEKGTTTTVSESSTVTEADIVAGSPSSITIKYEGSASDGAINITTSGTNTSGKTWSDL
ncbi:prepilin-type N-terminal cleavage/methylation domain-containing protein [Hypnocyclicus thermotrophus]|uniref:Prepilin-type N-terminal cleavage/methylation domain-containing protein n=1 Tax=Hypnocyclicus thermotrophus TaxID=1627895 RepID=A0AA46I5I3_9FUSO|nr:type II secretion system protein [Hypnocyclicus thermotrophus]TDT69796.1 prepilin-type N-terminal cleavage/methylation domain-containing protein [Hypnocyclicus thermotrophus]